MADPSYYVYAAAALLVFLMIALEEVPWRFNVLRVARRARMGAKRNGISAPAALDRIRRQTRLGGVVLGGFGAAASAFFAYTAFTGPPDLPLLAFQATLCVGTCGLALAFLMLAPRLFHRVEMHLLETSATTNSHADDMERPHGPRP